MLLHRSDFTILPVDVTVSSHSGGAASGAAPREWGARKLFRQMMQSVLIEAGAAVDESACIERCREMGRNTKNLAFHDHRGWFIRDCQPVIPEPAKSEPFHN